MHSRKFLEIVMVSKTVANGELQYEKSCNNAFNLKSGMCGIIISCIRKAYVLICIAMSYLFELDYVS